MALATGPLAQRRQAAPPLPDSGPATPQPPASGAPSLPDGCYLISLVPVNTSIFAYQGTLRIESMTGRMIASGDFYLRAVDEKTGTLPPSPDPKAGIPIFPINLYCYYLRVTDILTTDGGFDLTFEALRFSATEIKLLDGTATKWASENSFTARMKPVLAADPSNDPPTDDFPPPESFPTPELVFVGDIANSGGSSIGTLKLGLVSRHLRKGTVELNRVAKSEIPQGNGAGETWQTIFDKVGWDITLAPGDSGIAEPSGESWNAGEADAAMVASRAKANLDAEWRYDLLAVQRIDRVATPEDPLDLIEGNGERGYMYDLSAGVQREGFMIASRYQIPDTDKWGLVRGMRLGETPLFFRTAVHELGHAMGLQHNDIDNGFMNPTDAVARNIFQAHGAPFPTNMPWSFSRDDAHRLRHWPDLIVRPGAEPMPGADDAPSSPFTSDRHKLVVTPMPAAVPLGAPVRVGLALSNVSDLKVTAPSGIGLKAGFVRGRTIDASGTVRTFSPLVVNEARNALQVLLPGAEIDDSLTLFQGAEGDLFPAAGIYRLVVELNWHGPIVNLGEFIDIVVAGEALVTVTPPADDAHADAARKVLATPETLLALALGGDHLKDGIAAIGAALASDALRPHFAYIEAKRLATRFFQRLPDLQAAADLIDDTTVMSPAEFKKLARIVKSNAGSDGARALANALKAKAAKEAVGDDVKSLVLSL